VEGPTCSILPVARLGTSACHADKASCAQLRFDTAILFDQLSALLAGVLGANGQQAVVYQMSLPAASCGSVGKSAIGRIHSHCLAR